MQQQHASEEEHAAHLRKLQRVLDGDEADVAGSDLMQEDAGSLAEERMLRLKAEAEAADRSARLQVYEAQLAEYAAEKAGAAEALLEEARALAALMRRPGGDGGSAAAAAASATAASAAAAPGAVDALAERLAALEARLEQEALEARHFADQQRADVERTKRTSHAAELMAVDGGNGNGTGGANGGSGGGDDDDDDDGYAAAAGGDSKRLKEGAADDDGDGGDESGQAAAANGGAASVGPEPPLPAAASAMRERCRFIPLRLKLEERRALRLLEAALNVSEYTDKVDVLTWRCRSGRAAAQVRDLCAILSGLVVASDYRRGQRLVADREFADNAEFFQIGRRYKVMNPDKMRSEYGKLLYMLMDSASPAVSELLEFSCVRPLRTVAGLLEAGGAAALLDDPLVAVATAEIDARGRPRHEVQRAIKAKEKAREALARRYRTASLSEEDLLWALYSVADNNTYLAFNRDPVERMIAHFKAQFAPGAPPSADRSLAITSGRGGARLTHSHDRQYHFVLQTLTLWSEVATDMFRLWCLAEHDMLLRPNNGYRLCDTGQGLNRVQSAPSVARAMAAILARCQARLGGWVGSGVVHLGDHNVPNALMFIDKYTQVPRILNPVVQVLDELPNLAKDPAISGYLNAAFGGVDGARRAILVDFCRHAFDGSGADNFFDAGSCIDGRLTSAWNWCSQIEKKACYPVFRLAGFTGFDGEWK